MKSQKSYPLKLKLSFIFPSRFFPFLPVYCIFPLRFISSLNNEWTPELHTAVDEALKARPLDIAPFLFCNRKGQCYMNEETGTADGWDSLWQRFMERLLAETKVENRFTEHDLRAKCASNADTLEQARALLTHVDSRATVRIYRRKPERVRPGKGIGK
uniref:Phage integrase family protein n=1 Tax=Candidatus Kentrum sp. TC TaxID=2126339 RepID=A0A451A000_9GAMM|nr:MAG: hypothetical protein BECKTC1821D_GA0114238_102334 [Candidatus Kentron sp. TC]VFK59355.1 MAG: hypothetical protein BECKTC1821F_GA0114240_103220 [Candidatus Kentron sp. TC]